MLLPCWQAHPPIHPTKHTAGEHSWNSEKARLYEFIVRSFLATCSKAAVGFETRLEVQVAEEGFSTTGTVQPFKHVFLIYLLSKQTSMSLDEKNHTQHPPDPE